MIGGHNGPCAVGPAGACRKSDEPDGNCEVYNGKCRMTAEYKKSHTPKKRAASSKAAPKAKPSGAAPTAAELAEHGSFANWSLAAAAARAQASSRKVASPKKAASPKKVASPKKAAAYKPTKQGVCPPLSPEDCFKHPACSWIAPEGKKAHCRHTKYLRGGYSKIYNPATGRDVNVLSSQGKQILKGYINKLNGGY